MGISPANARGIARPTLHCRGSTRARVRIAWPGEQDLARGARLFDGKHVPSKVRRWAYLFATASAANGVDPHLVAAVIRVESDGDPLAWNLDSDAHGLMQVLHASFDPVANIRTGVSMLAGFERRFGSRDLALAAYNAGPGAVQTYAGIPPYTETQTYVVMVDYYRDLFAGERLSAPRVRAFKHAVAEAEAFYRRVCGGKSSDVRSQY
jgi:soluble lytic murein transglycosylase-like protein